MSKILHIVPRMVQGGAEKLLIEVLRREGGQHDHQALVLFGDGDERMTESVAPKVHVRQPKSDVELLRDTLNVRRWIAAQNPDGVVAWMYHASVLARLIVPTPTPVMAYVHNTDLAVDAKPVERMAQKALARLARSPRMSLLYSGSAAQRYHEGALSYPSARANSLPNGVSLPTFTPDPARGRRARQELGIPDESFVFGAFGRFNPQKNWPLILDAVSAAARKAASVRLIAAGRGVSFASDEFYDLVRARNLGDQVVALDSQADMARLYDAVDVLLIGSRYGEAFPLVLLEALAMGKPVIATALGSVPEVLDGLIEPIPAEEPERFVAAAVDAATGVWPGLAVKPEDLRRLAVSRYGLDNYCVGLDASINTFLGTSQS